MKAFYLTEGQITKLKTLAEAICPQYLLRATQHRSNVIVGEGLESKTFQWWYISNGDAYDTELIGWFEFCMTEVAQMTIKKYAETNHQPESWCHRLIMQKLGHDLPSINPIDTLYELWSNPQSYVEGL